MATVALFCLSRSLAHAGRVATLARALGARGHRCVLHGAPGWLGEPALVDEACGELRLLDEPPLDEVLRPARGLLPLRPERETFQAALADDRAALDACRPDVVVTDNRRGVGVAAREAGVPVVSLTGAALLGPHLGLRVPEAAVARVCAPVLGVPPAAWRGRRGPDGTLLAPVPLPGTLAALTGATHAHELCLGDRTLVLDAPGLLPTTDLPPGASQPGPLLPRLRAATDLPERRGPRVWITMGATGDAGLVPGLARGLLRWGVDVVVSLAGEIPGATCRPLVDADALLPTTDLVVCHGGSGTVHHALAHGVPVLALPTHLEQAMVALAVEAAGVGRALAATTARLEPVAALALATGLLERPPRVDLAVDPPEALGAAVAAVEELAP